MLSFQSKTQCGQKSLLMTLNFETSKSAVLLTKAKFDRFLQRQKVQHLFQATTGKNRVSVVHNTDKMGNSVVGSDRF